MANARSVGRENDVVQQGAEVDSDSYNNEHVQVGEHPPVATVGLRTHSLFSCAAACAGAIYGGLEALHTDSSELDDDRDETCLMM